ncbi:hypothetical protein DRE_04179 [Drechslerella stenobrocha 248]|uniref:Uncharacterized protein n=1 Tax=Drechslerella stenobrocha 248 TaxID=1043628 RepID=W7I2Q0_9PEZI|nr:hypothetical protein DRE_04179 [Drechslerella stenobrocha 248]
MAAKPNKTPTPGLPYANPAFSSSEDTHPAKHNPSWTDPLPFAARFEPLRQTFLPAKPLLPGPPNTALSNTQNPAFGPGLPHDPLATEASAMTGSSPPAPSIPSRSSKRLSHQALDGSSSIFSIPTSPLGQKRPSRFQSDFSYLKGTPRQKSPDPAFKAHRRAFSEEANLHKKSVFHEEVADEREENGEETTGTNNARGGMAQHGGSRAPNAPPSNPTGLGLSYVPANEGSGKIGKEYTNVPPDDDDDDYTSIDGVIMKTRKPKMDWLNIMILILSIYSTVGSILFFVVAAAKPRYGTRVSTSTGLRPQDAQLISAIFAKTIEISFVSVFVSFLGQVLSRRALMTRSKGVNIAELSMRSWVTQPGTLITHTSSVRFAGLTFLGALSLTATLFATFYTTAADTLVSPKLAWGSPQPRNLTGLVHTSYANTAYRSQECQTVISTEEDPQAEGYFTSLAKSTCDNILSAGRSYRDLSDWNAAWVQAQGQPFADAKKRPAAPSALNLVNCAGAWMHVSAENGVNRAVLAMPHPGVISATRNSSLNGILQPEESGSGYGSFFVQASVPNPALTVTCAPVSNSSLDWYLIQSNSTNLERNGTADAFIQQTFDFTNNATFQDTAGAFLRTGPYEAPRFAKRPVRYNTILARSTSPSVFLLVRTPADRYVMCGMTGMITPNCSTEFQAFESSGNATANCDLNNHLAFKEDLARLGVSTAERPIPGALGAPVADSIAPDFRFIADPVLRSVALNTGVTDGHASIGRFLSQIALDTRELNLNPARPSLAEGLAVVLGNAMITSAADSVFTTYYPYVDPILDPPMLEFFNAQVATIEYASGAGSGWKPVFYVVLAGVMVMNVFCLIYFAFVRDGFVTDWTEVQNLVCVTMDGGVLRSPYTDSPDVRGMGGAGGEPWKGTGGTGPAGGQYKVGFWFTERDGRWYVTDRAVSDKSAAAKEYGGV